MDWLKKPKSQNPIVESGLTLGWGQVHVGACRVAVCPISERLMGEGSVSVPEPIHGNAVPKVYVSKFPCFASCSPHLVVTISLQCALGGMFLDLESISPNDGLIPNQISNHR